MSMTTTFLWSILAGILMTWIFELVLKTNDILYEKYYTHNSVMFGYHFHHSTYGLALFVSSGIMLLIGYDTAPLVLLGMGIGIIVMHTISDGRFVFIEKQRGENV